MPSVFPWIRTSPRKRKEPIARNFNALNSRAHSLNTSVISAEEPAKEIPASVSDVESNSGSTTQDYETQTKFTDHEAYLTNIISNNDKRIQEMEQKIKEIKRQLQCMQWQNHNLNDRLFTLENLKSKDSSATFYSGFPNWEIFMVVYTYLDPGETGENISYWHSTNPGLFSDYTVDNKEDESQTKKGRARS